MLFVKISVSNAIKNNWLTQMIVESHTIQEPIVHVQATIATKLHHLAGKRGSVTKLFMPAKRQEDVSSAGGMGATSRSE